jgi:hypothetical protein
MTSLKRGLAFSIRLLEHSGSHGLWKSFIIRHDPNQLFEILGYLPCSAIHDNNFATELRDARRGVPDRNSAAYERHQV